MDRRLGGPLILQLMESEPNLWRVMKKEQDLRERPRIGDDLCRRHVHRRP